MDYRQNLIEDDEGIGELIRGAKRVAVLGIKTEAQKDQPAYYVPAYLRSAGVELVPVPVYYPEAREILGKKVERDLAAISGKVDILDVFRRPADLEKHLPDMKKLAPRAVWFQQGIRNDAVAEELARAGIKVVQDRCLMVEWRRHARPAPSGPGR
ncbi:MAG TPA: CoA-binding protein [Anaeromyxobacteraceae bacterium]|nr:CoA-binding protein [Anaeromyxobacteraceae bacterium]